MPVNPLRSLAVIAIAAVISVAAATGVAAHGSTQKTAASGGDGTRSMPRGQTMMPGQRMGRLMMPNMDPGRGKTLFVAKGCVACHAINGVGGHDAPAMDSHTMDQMMSPFDFAAKMWNHAQGMIAAQEEVLGEQVMLTGQDLADIVAFVHHDVAQHDFTEADLTPAARKMMDHGHGEQPAHIRHSEELEHQHHMGGHE